MTTGRKKAQAVLRRPYSRVLMPEDDGRYSAEILEFPGCFSQGNTATEAIKNLEEAALNWVEAALEQGLRLPDPVAPHNASGKFALRLPRGLHSRLARFAEKEGVSLNQFIVAVLSEHVGERSALREHITHLERLLQRLAGTVLQGFQRIAATPSTEHRFLTGEIESTKTTDQNVRVLN